jgi:hypothetical protein
MAISASQVLEIRFGGSDTNGGGFKTGASGTDWSQQNNAQYAVTDGVTNGTTTITSATANWGTDVVGNLIYVAGGTGSITAGWYEVTSRTSSTAIVVDRSTGLTAGTGVTLNLGGALATPGQAAAILNASGQKAWWKYSASTFTMTTSTAGPAGPISLASGLALVLEGYDVTRGDRTGNRPKASWGSIGDPGSLKYMATAVGGAKQVFANIAMDANSTNNVSCFSLNTSRISAIDCQALNATGSGTTGFTCQTSLIRCYALNCLTGFSGLCTTADCQASACTTGFSGMAACVHCLATACSTAGFSNGGNGYVLDHCTADSCGTNGFAVSGGIGHLTSCLATNTTTTGFALGTNVAALSNCAAYKNGANTSGTALINEAFITLTADPYVNKVGGDFRPNTTAGGGAALRGVGIGVYGQTDNSDIGAVQHTDPSGTGGINSLVNGGLVL